MNLNHLLVFWTALLASAAFSSDDTAIQLTVPASAPANASGFIDPSYPGFAFEQASFYNYSFDANGNPNTFSENLINNVLKRTGGSPILRVGGTSGDFGSYNASQTYVANRPATQGGPAFRPPFLSVGPSYFEAYRNFPKAKYVFMVPLVHHDINNTLEWTRLGLEAIGDRLQALEIGNEPDLYPRYSVPNYVEDFLYFEKVLSASFPKQLGGGGRPGYQAMDIASGGARRFQIAGAMKEGINSTGAVSQVAYHLYQWGDRPGAGLQYLQRRIANHTAVIRALSVFIPHIQYLQEYAPGTPFILSENGNTLGRQDIEQRNILTTALWNVDYQLFALTIGVSRVNNQQIVLPGYQMWEPVESDFGPPLVRANYYSQPLVAEFIGTSGVTRVSEIQINGTELMSAYVAYENDEPVRIAILNLELWIPDHGERPTAKIELTGLPSRVTSAAVHRLTAPEGAYANDTLSWRGLQWTYESNGQEVRMGSDDETAEVKDGALSVLVEATSAVILDLCDSCAYKVEL